MFKVGDIVRVRRDLASNLDAILYKVTDYKWETTIGLASEQRVKLDCSHDSLLHFFSLSDWFDAGVLELAPQFVYRTSLEHEIHDLETMGYRDNGPNHPLTARDLGSITEQEAYEVYSRAVARTD